MPILRLVDADAETARYLRDTVGQLDGAEAVEAMTAYRRNCGFEGTARGADDARPERLAGRLRR